jgi:hypothetical protein
MKNYILSIVFITFLTSCKSNENPSPNFDFSNEMESSGSFLIRQKDKSEKVELSIKGDPLALGIDKTAKQFDVSKLTITITEFSNVIPQYSEQFSLFLMGKLKNNPVTKTWVVSEGKVTIQLIDGKPVANRDCNNPYNISLKTTDMKFTTSDKKEVIVIKSINFQNIRVGWCHL